MYASKFRSANDFTSVQILSDSLIVVAAQDKSQARKWPGSCGSKIKNLCVMIPSTFRSRLQRWFVFAAVLAAAFSVYLFQWARFCLDEDLFSYALIIPFVSAWLVWQMKSELKYEFTPSMLTVLILGVVGAVLFAAPLMISSAAEDAAAINLSLRMLSFVALLAAGAVHLLGGQFIKQILFPMAFLVFVAPIPPAWVAGIETGLQHASADVSGWFFSLIGASYLQSGLIFQLPNITIEVARECSGIRSTLVLFITSLIAGYLFLEQSWQRVLFCALVIPLGIARNGFRIVTIGWLCTEYGPEMIHSPIHHRGGPVFFAISLIPLFLLLFLFRRMNRPKPCGKAPPHGKPVEVAECAN
jgi:exosortase C (VPDSG-CTERM-specific)